MAKREVIQERLSFWKIKYEKLQAAYIALIEGGVQSYEIDDRSLTRFNISDLEKQIEDAEKKIDALEAALDGKRPRKAFGIIPMDM